MTGALNLDDKIVSEVMIPWENVYKIPINTRLNFEVLLEIFKKGYSRIPVYRNIDNKQDIVGVLFVKELILLDPEDEIDRKSVV